MSSKRHGRDTVTISRNEYERLLTEKYKAGDWFLCSRPLIRLLSMELGLLLQHLINIGQMKAGPDGWFPCTVADIQDELGEDVDRNVQHRLLSRLRDAGLIDMEKRGNPGHRHVRVDIVKLERAVQKSQSTGNPVNSVNWKSSQLDDSKSSQLDDSKSSSLYKEKEQKRKNVRGAGSADAPLADARGGRSAPPGDDDEQPAPARQGSAARPQPTQPKGHPAKVAPRAPLTDNGNAAPSWSEACARKLLNSAASKGWVSRDFSCARWAKVFRANEERLTQPRISAVLDWFCLGKIERPTVGSADGFFRVFSWIADKMAKDAPAEDAPPPPVSADAAEIAADLALDGWPMGSAAQLPEEVEASLKEARRIYARLRLFMKGRVEVPGARESDLEFMRQYVAGWEGSNGITPESFVTHWYKKLHRRLCSWEDWGGELKGFRVRVGTKNFNRTLDAEDQYCGGRGKLAAIAREWLKGY